MTPDQIIILVIIGVMLVLIASNRLPTELIALGVLLTLWATGLVNSQQALAGFSSSVVLTLVGLFVITGALETTGIVQQIAQRLNQLGKGSEQRLIIVFMSAGAAMSLVMNNVAAGAVLLPAALRVADISEVKPSRLLLPMSFGTLLGGMATYLTTANIVMSELLREQGLAGLNMLSFIPTGGLIVLAGILYMLVIGQRLLPDRDGVLNTIKKPSLRRTYQLAERLWQVRVIGDSPLDGTSLRDSNIGQTLGMTVLTVQQDSDMLINPEGDYIFGAGDTLVVMGREERLQRLIGWGVRLLDQGVALPEGRVRFTEVLIGPRSEALGKTLTEVRFRRRFGASVVALWREGRPYRTDIGKMPLRVGDALLVLGPREALLSIAEDPNYIMPHDEFPRRPTRPGKAGLAGLITLVVLGTAIADVLPLPGVMLAGATLLVLTRCISMQDFYDSISWNVLFLIAGILPLSIAIAESGLAELVGLGVVNGLAGFHPLVLVAGMWLLTVAVAQVIGGQVTALLVGPIAINAALQIGISPQAISVAVAIGCSTAFLTPIAHPVNLLMMSPGGYQFSDFFKVGLGMTVVVLITLLVGMALIWGIT